ncbi:MAG: glutamine amidotransferase [Alphaproteobacteria bacterium]|nr:glutamine amidotransferase [Alphaproteobacteria bacterium]
MKPRILLIVHQETSNPGRIGQLVEEFGCEPVICRHACGDPLPESLDDYAASVIFGGPMSANDDHLPAIRNELDWLEVPLRADKPFLGICLGAQMLARYLGGTVESHPEGYHEIGFYKVNACPDGKELFDDGHYFYQWHSEGFTLPHGVEHLAASELFPNQAFRTGNAYGLQFHPDVTGEMMKRWSGKAAHRMVLPGAQARDLQHAGHAAHNARIESWSRRFFAHWLAPVLGQAAAEPMAMAGSD